MDNLIETNRQNTIKMYEDQEERRAEERRRGAEVCRF